MQLVYVIILLYHHFNFRHIFHCNHDVKIGMMCKNENAIQNRLYADRMQEYLKIQKDFIDNSLCVEHTDELK